VKVLGAREHFPGNYLVFNCKLRLFPVCVREAAFIVGPDRVPQVLGGQKNARYLNEQVESKQIKRTICRRR
jgi:hypothetical protein